MNKKLLIGLLTTIPTIGIAATTTVLTSCKSNSNESTTQDSNSESSSNLDFKDGNSITEDIIEKDNNANNIIESKLDIGMLYYKNLMINSDRQDTINFNPLSKYDYETFKETAYTNATQKLSTNDSDKYNNFRLKLYSRKIQNTKNNDVEWTQLESFDNQIIHNAIDYAIKNYYYSKNLWLMQQARFDVDLSLAETGFNNSNPTFYGKERDWKEENNFIFQDLWVSSHNLNGLNVSIVNNGNTIKFKGLNFEQLLCFNMFLNHYEFERNSQSYSNRYNGWLWVNAENAYVNLFHSVKNSPWVDFYIKYNGYSAGDQGNGRDNKILEHGTNKNYPDRNFVSFKVDILKAYDISEKDKNQVYNNKEINVSLDRDFSLNDNINKNQNLVFVDYLNKNKYYSVDTENDNDVQEYLENNILKYNTLSDTSKTVFNEIANQVSKNIFDFEQQVSFNRNYVNIPSYWWNGKDNDPWEAKKDDIKKLYNDKTPYNLNNITNKDLLIQKYNNSFNLDKKIIYLDENNSNGFNIKYNSQILKFNNETTIEKLGVFKNAEIAPVIEYNGVPLFKINLSDKQMTKLQNINANNVIRYDSKSTNKYYWVLDQVILETLEEDFNSLSRKEFYNSFQNVSQNVSFTREEESNETTKYIPKFKESPVIKLNNENKLEFNYDLYENGKELLPRVNEHIDFISEQHYRINSIIKQYNDIKDFYWSILDNKIVKPEEIVFVYNWVASPQVNNVIQSLHLDYIIDTKWNNNPYIFPSFIKI